MSVRKEEENYGQINEYHPHGGNWLREIVWSVSHLTTVHERWRQAMLHDEPGGEGRSAKSPIMMRLVPVEQIVATHSDSDPRRPNRSSPISSSESDDSPGA